MVDLARHLRRREPVDESAPVQKGRVELLGPGPDDPRCACPGACMLFGHVAALLDLGQIRREYLTGEQVRSRPIADIRMRFPHGVTPSRPFDAKVYDGSLLDDPRRGGMIILLSPSAKTENMLRIHKTELNSQCHKQYVNQYGSNHRYNGYNSIFCL